MVVGTCKLDSASPASTYVRGSSSCLPWLQHLSFTRYTADCCQKLQQGLYDTDVVLPCFGGIQAGCCKSEHEQLWCPVFHNKVIYGVILFFLLSKPVSKGIFVAGLSFCLKSSQEIAFQVFHVMQSSFRWQPLVKSWHLPC